jgi:pimeloyl-ACP methyl ester carboxylesterase
MVCMVAPLVILTPENDYTGYSVVMHLEEVAGVQVGLETLGDAGDPAVLHLHGFPVDHRILRDPMERLHATHPGWRRVYVDLPGFGIAPPSPALTSSDDALALVLALLEAVGTGGPTAIVGQSWGGYLAHAAAERRPDAVAGIALICPMTVPEHAARDVPVVPPVEIPPDLAATADEDELTEFRDIAVVADAAQFAFFRSNVLPALRVADADTVARISAAYALADPPQATFAGPALIITGRRDASVGHRDAWRLAERLPRATYAVLDGAGHHAHVEREPETAALLGAWLTDAAAR